jgi:hypothetical protein
MTPCSDFIFSYPLRLRASAGNCPLFSLTVCSRKDTLSTMFEIRKTELFSIWLDELRDIKARARIQARIERLCL